MTNHPAIETSLAVIEEELRRLNRVPLLNSFAPGVPPETVQDWLSKIDLTSVPDLDALYSWHNGLTDDGPAATLGQVWMFPIFYLMSIEESYFVYRAVSSSGRWSDAWWPVFADGGGDNYVVELPPLGDGKVFHFRNEFPECPLEYNSLQDMMATIAAAFVNRVYFADPDDDVIDEIPGAFDQLAAEMNPDIQWWNDPNLA